MEGKGRKGSKGRRRLAGSRCAVFADKDAKHSIDVMI
jgi:hypothetical protein